MQGCKYKEKLKCKVCTHAFHKECTSFVLAHAVEVARPLKSFVYSSKYKTKEPIVWSKDINRAKSVALDYALTFNLPIKKLSASQLISMALNGDTVEGTVLYIECTQKFTGDIEKVKGVFSSFIEAATLNDVKVSVFVAPTVQFPVIHSLLFRSKGKSIL